MNLLQQSLLLTVVGGCALGATLPAIADYGYDNDREIEGRITALNPQEQSFTVNGLKFFTSPETDYDEGFRQFSDLRLNQRVDVEFITHNGAYIATGIEPEDYD